MTREYQMAILGYIGHGGGIGIVTPKEQLEKLKLGKIHEKETKIR